MEIVSFQSGQVSPGIKYYTVDTEADKNNLPVGEMGNRCYVIESKKWYILNSNGEWVPFAAEGGAVDTDAILSAVENMTDAQRSQFISNLGFGTVFTFMGSVASRSDLPNSNNKVGYVYYVELDSSEYVWVVNQSQPNGYWEELGETFDVTVDSELSNTSKNPVQNKTIALALNELHGSMDDMAEMLDSMIMLRTELTVDTTQDAWSGANWDELIAAAKNGRAVSLGVDGADAQTVLLHYDELANSAEIKIIETEPKIYYYSTLAGAVSDSNAGTVGTNADASQGTAVVSLYVDDNGLPNIVLLQNTSITSGLSFERNAVLDLNGHKITAELGNPESHAYAVLVNSGYSLRIKGQTLGSAIESNTGSGSAVTLLYNNVGSYLEVLGGEYTVNAAETTIGVCVRNYGNVLLKDMTINATAQKVGGITSGSGSVSLRQNNNIQNVTVNVVGLSDSTRAIDIQNAESTLISNCHLYANSDTESGRIYGIYLDNTSKPTIIQNSEIVADSNYHYADGSYTVLSMGIITGTTCSYLLLQNCTVKGCHASAELHCSTDIDGGYYSSAGHGVYFSGSYTAHRVKGAEMDDLYVGTHTNTNQNHVGAYIGGGSGATGISVYADNTNISGSNYSWVLRNSSGESDNALYISNSNINNKTIRIDDTTTLRLYLGEGNSFDANDTTRPANVVETGADYTFSPTVTTISYIGHPVTGSLTERDPGSVAIREISLKSSGGAVVTDYALVQSAAVSAAISTAVAGKANTADLATVATSGSYNDLSNKPTIPTVPTDEISANTAARHTHSNKSLLDTYAQTEVNLADAVSKKHTHSNKTVLDGITAAKLLPTVTTSDNDKFLRVVSGTWAAATVPSAETASF